MPKSTGEEHDVVEQERTEFLRAFWAIVYDLVLVLALLVGLWIIERAIVMMKLGPNISHFFEVAHTISSAMVLLIFMLKSVAIVAIVGWRQVCKYSRMES